MSYPVIIGATLETQQGMRFFWTSTDGETAEWNYEGPAAAVLTKYQALCSSMSASAAVFDSVDYRDENGKGVLLARGSGSTAGGGTTAAVTEVWELYGMDVTRPIGLHPAFATIAAARKMVIKSGIEQMPPWSKAQLAISSPSTEEDFYDLLATGTTDYYAVAFLLRKTETTTSSGTVTASVGGIGFTVTAGAINPPSTFRATISSIQGWDGTVTGSVGEWLKRPSQVRQIGGNKYQVITEWLWAVTWSKILYNGSGTP